MPVKISLNEYSIFSGLSAPELSLLAETARERHFAAGEKIIQKDDTRASLFLIHEGRVRVVLPKHDGGNIQLNLMGKGEFFGEMSLLTGKPRSAIVIADIDTTVIEIERDQFMDHIRNKPDMALKILTVLADRVQYSHGCISEIAERVYHEAYPKIDEALTSQLEAAKVVYGKTEDRASHVLASVERSWITLTRFITIILCVASAIGATLTYFGYSEFKEVRIKFDDELKAIMKQNEDAKVALKDAKVALSDLNAVRTEAEGSLDKIKKTADRTILAKEIVHDISKIRSDLILPEQYRDAAEQREQTLWLAILFPETEPKLHKNYLSESEIKKWDSEIILEAAIAYIQFLDRSGYQPEPKHKRISQVVDALLYVLAEDKPRDWRVHLKVRKALVTLGNMHGGVWKNLITTSLRLKMGTTNSNSDLDIALAQVLFEIDASSTQAKEKGILWAAMHGEGSPWRSFGAAVQIIRIGKKKAWKILLPSLHKNTKDGYIAAFLLAQLGPDKLVELGIYKHQRLVQNRDPLQLIKQRLESELDKRSYEFSKDPYRKQYIEILIDQIAGKKYPTQ